MASRPRSWHQDYDDSELDPTPLASPSSNERHLMLPDMPAAHSTAQHTHHDSPRTSAPPPEAGPSFSRIPRSDSFRSVASSPLNPSSPSSSPIFSPFARPGSRSSAQVTRIPSEESRVLAATLPTGSRGSAMVLYRRIDSPDHILLPPSLPHANRSSIISISADSFVSLSSDSKYPSGMLATERRMVAYAFDPMLDDDPNEVDPLHDPDKKLAKISGRPTSWRGLKNITTLVLLVVGLLALFVAYPVYAFYHDTGRAALIVGNTRINTTGQAGPENLDARSQIPIVSARFFLLLPSVSYSLTCDFRSSFDRIDPATPPQAKLRIGRFGERYKLVFSDEFETDGRTFHRGKTWLFYIPVVYTNVMFCFR